MSVQVRRRREAASFLSTFVGAQGELLVDTTNNRVQVHDGATPGGWPAAKLADVIGRTTVADAAYAAKATDRTIAITALTAPRIITLPAAAAFPTGTTLTIVDESGACASFSVGVTAAGTDTINGLVTWPIAVAFGYLALESNGTGKWTIVDAPGVARTAVADASYTALASDRTIAVTALTASRTITLPAASAYPTGTQLLVVDESGACSTTNAITLGRAGTDTINGTTSASIATAYGYLALASNGVGRWTVVDQTPFSALTTVAQSASGANMQFGVAELLVTLSGASVTTTLQIPARAIVFGVSSRTVAAVTGAPSFGVGVAGNTTQFGGGLGTSVGSSNAGVIGPSAFYTATPIVITAASGSFTAGQVRLAIQYLICGVPTT